MSILVAFAGFCSPPPRHDRCRRVAGAMGGRAKRAALLPRQQRCPACTWLMCHAGISLAAAEQRGKCPCCCRQAHQINGNWQFKVGMLAALELRASALARCRAQCAKLECRVHPTATNSCRRRSRRGARGASHPRERGGQMRGRRFGRRRARSHTPAAPAASAADAVVGMLWRYGSVPSPARYGLPDCSDLAASSGMAAAARCLSAAAAREPRASAR